MSDSEMVEKKAKAHSVKHAHDHAFQAAMSDLRVARDFLEHHLPLLVVVLVLLIIWMNLKP